MSLPARRALIGCMAFVCLVFALSGCGGAGADGPADAWLSEHLVPLPAPVSPSLGSDPTAGEAAGHSHPSAPDGHEPGPPGSPAAPADTATTRSAAQMDGSAGSPGPGGLSGNTESGEDPAPEDSDSSGTDMAAETNAANRRLAERPRNNPQAADLLDHWGHRRSRGLAAGLGLSSPLADADAAELETLRTAAGKGGETVAPNLHADDEVEVLGAHRGVTYGRWAGGFADTLSIEFDLSRVEAEVRDDPAFRATFERAGKAWSRRIADTWSTWERSAGEFKGRLAGSQKTEVRVGEDGETSTGLEIHVTVEDLLIPGQGGHSGIQPGESWEPHFGSVAIDSELLQDAGEARVFSTVAHEIGHVLGSWMGEHDDHDSYTDTAAGTWTGPNVAAVHGGPAPFQDDSNPQAWVNGERDPAATEYDFAHSGVCVSLMSYCRQEATLPALLPHAIDFAFLADLGLTLAEETDRPETYGLAGWTEYAAFTLSLSRELEIALADPQPYHDGPVNRWQKLDVADLLRVGAGVFGHRSTAAHAAGLSGTARYAGRLIGTALDRSGLPPVTGDASLALDLGTLDGTASFTSLLVHPDGIPETFAGGALHYPFGVADNEIVGTGAGLTLQADFYGPGHEEVAGVIHDPRTGLLGSFGAATDDRPTREELIADADYLSGSVYRRGSATEADNGWYRYRCETQSACESRHNGSDGWTEWTATTREQVLAATAAWAWRDTSRPVRDRGFARITRLTDSATDGGQGRYAMDGYAAAVEKGIIERGAQNRARAEAATRGSRAASAKTARQISRARQKPAQAPGRKAAAR